MVTGGREASTSVSMTPLIVDLMAVKQTNCGPALLPTHHAPFKLYNTHIKNNISKLSSDIGHKKNITQKKSRPHHAPLRVKLEDEFWKIHVSFWVGLVCNTNTEHKLKFLHTMPLLTVIMYNKSNKCIPAT